MTDSRVPRERPESVLLVIDTATSHATLALARVDGAVIGRREWEAGHGHSASLLPNLETLLASARADLRETSGVVVGTGPGRFTALRVGVATAKTIAYSLTVPIVGVSTLEALAFAAALGERPPENIVERPGRRSEFTVLLPAGPNDRYIARVAVMVCAAATQFLDPPRLVPPSELPSMIEPGSALVAVDLPAAEVGEDAVRRGEAALAALGPALAAVGADRLRRGLTDDVSMLVPAYVAIPRGVTETGMIASWSPELR